MLCRAVIFLLGIHIGDDTLIFVVSLDIILLVILISLFDILKLTGLAIIVAVWPHFHWELELLLDTHLTLFFAILFEVLWKVPRIFMSHTISHILNFIMTSSLLGFLDHVLIYLYEINDLLFLVNSRRLIRGESNLTIDHEVIIVQSLFNIL